MFKKLIAVTAFVLLAGCNFADDYDINATRKQAEEECQKYNSIRTVMFLDYTVSAKPWTVNCVNIGTGNTFKVYVEGVLK